MIGLETPLPPDGHGQAFALALLRQAGADEDTGDQIDLSARIVEGLAAYLRQNNPAATVADLAAFVQRALMRTWRAFMLTSPSVVAGQCGLALAVVPDDRLDTARADVARARRARRIEHRFGFGKGYVACTATSRTASPPRCRPSRRARTAHRVSPCRRRPSVPPEPSGPRQSARAID